MMMDTTSNEYLEDILMNTDKLFCEMTKNEGALVGQKTKIALIVHRKQTNTFIEED